MIKLSFSKEWLLAVKQLSPSMLLLSLTIHGLLLLMPLSLSPKRKIFPSEQASKQEQILIGKSADGHFFSDNKALVKQSDLSNTPIPSNNPQFTSELASLPQDATAQTQLPIPEIQPTPTLPPLPEIPPVAPVDSNVSIMPSQEVQHVTDGLAAVVVAPQTTSSKKRNPQKNTVPVTPVTPTQESPKPVATTSAPISESISPEPLPSSQEKETFEIVLNKLNEELSLSEEVNSQPEKFSSTTQIQHIYGTGIDKSREEVAASLISNLELQGFKVSQLNNHASGLVYVVTKNKFTEYITFTSNREKTGTVIITWINSLEKEK